MDLLKELRTGVQAVEGFSEIHFRCFILVKALPNMNRTKKLNNTPSRIQILEHAREKFLDVGSLVSLDTHAGGLWLFGTNNAEVVNQLPLLDECVAFAAENHREEGLRWINALDNTDQSFFPEIHSEYESGIGVVKASQAISGHVSERGFNFRRFYNLFLTAVISSISFTLARDNMIVPLNFCTFVSPRSASSHFDGEDSIPTSIHLSTIKAQLTPIGSILISSLSKFQPELQRLRDFRKFAASKKTRNFGLVRIAPNGIVARLQGFGIVQRSQESISDRVRGKIDFSSWRLLVDRWLRQRGIRLENLTEEDAWVQVVISSKNFEQILEWPIDLCFCYQEQLAEDGPEFAATGGLSHEWSAIYEDPLYFTQTWISEKGVREKELEIRKNRRHDEIAANGKRNSFGSSQDQTVSPFGRNGPFGDSQTISGVYPTPPDGLPPHSIPNIHFGMPSQNIENSAMSDGPAIQNFDLEDGIVAETPPKEHQMQSRAMSMDFEMGGHGDFFVDPDGDLLEAADMNEMDFSYFDEPEIAENKIDIDANVPEVEQMEILDPDSNAEMIKSYKTNPADELQQALPFDASSSNPIKVDSPKNSLNTDDVDETPRENLDEQKNLAPDLTGTPKFSESNDNYQQEIMLDCTATELGDSAKPLRNLDAVSFGSRLEIYESKYGLGGRFGGLETVSPVMFRKKKLAPPAIPRLDRFSAEDILQSRIEPAIQSEIAVTEAGFDRNKSFNDGDTDESYDTTTSLSETEAVVASRDIRVRKLSQRQRYMHEQPHLENGRANLQAQYSPEPFSSQTSTIHQLNNSKSAVISCLHYLTASKPLDWSLIGFPAPRQSGASSHPWAPLNKSDYIAVAQIMVEQLILFPNYPSLLPITDRNLEDQTKFTSLPSLVVQEAVSKIFAHCKDQDLLTFLSTDSKSIETLKYAQDLPKTNRLPSPRFEHPIVRIPIPHMRITKTDTQWEVFPPALAFWDTLGLGPCNGPKDIIAYCMYPQCDNIENYVKTFLTTVGNTYEMLKLGQHSLGDAVAGTKGMIPIRLPAVANRASIIASTREVCISLAQALANSELGSRCIVIYIVSPFEDSDCISAICSCFWTMQQTYKEALIRHPKKLPTLASDLVLQIAPLGLITTPDYPAVLDPETAANFARQVYDRCPSRRYVCSQSAPEILSGASLQLESNIPKAIQFQLTPEAPVELLKENSYLHIAYSFSLDEDWITVAWIDSTGEYQATISYSMTGGRIFAEVAKEIWETTIDIIKRRRVTWRLFLVKAGTINLKEKQVWVDLIQKPKIVPTRMLIFCVDTNPTLVIAPKVPQTDSHSIGNVMPQGVPHSTPVNTPGAIPSTPDQLGPAPTPPSGPLVAVNTPNENSLGPEIDPNAVITDVAQETWAIVLPHQLNTSPSTIDYEPALASGYLMKRGSARENESMRLMEVNLIHCELTGAIQTQRAYDALLREGIFLYSNLGVLARARGVEDGKSIRPWHIAAVQKGTESLSRHMCAI